jgi:hypothetical protein
VTFAEKLRSSSMTTPSISRLMLGVTKWRIARIGQ